jgi:hypothetical protein
MLRLACVLVACSVLAGCGPKGRQPDPDLSTARTVAWTNTAKELSGGLRGARLYGFGGGAMGGETSAASGALVLSGAWTDRVVVIAAQSAKTGEIVWRRTLPTGADGWADCADDDESGPVFVCKIGKPKSAALWVMADRTGAVRKKIPVKPGTVFGVSGDDLYLAAFTPNRKGTTLNVDVERRSWASGKTLWTQKASFAIEGWGHDGDTGFEFGRDRVLAYSAAWQVILDKPSGRLLDRSDQGRWESELGNGGRVVLDSGDGTSDRVRVTLFSPDGRPIAELTDATYPAPYEADPDRLVIGRRIVSLATGRTAFAAPKHTRIIAVAAGGRLAVVEPEEFEFRKNRIPLTVYDVATGKKSGSVALRGNVSDVEIAGGNGVVKVVGHYDDKTDDTLPSTLEIFDVRNPARVTTVSIGKKSQEPQWVTLVKTSAGFAATGGGAVRGFVATN